MIEPINIPKPRLRKRVEWMQLDGQHREYPLEVWDCEGYGIAEWGRSCAHYAYAEWCRGIKRRFPAAVFAGIDLCL